MEKYRRGLVRDANRQLRGILDSADEAAIHDFRIALKRLGVLYRFLQQIDPRLPVKQRLKPARGLFKLGGEIRNMQIAIGLIDEAGEFSPAARRSLLRPLLAEIRRAYRQFQRYAHEQRLTTVRLPSIAATGIAQSAIRRQRPAFIKQLRADILEAGQAMDDDEWHRKRILLKRYHHITDAFVCCPGFNVPASLLKQVTLLEQLLGDWHDRVTAIALLRARFAGVTELEPPLARLDEQRQALLASSQIYLGKLAKAWPEDSPEG